jgi:hypothetical protein
MNRWDVPDRARITGAFLELFAISKSLANTEVDKIVRACERWRSVKGRIRFPSLGIDTVESSNSINGKTLSDD